MDERNKQQPGKRIVADNRFGTDKNPSQSTDPATGFGFQRKVPAGPIQRVVSVGLTGPYYGVMRWADDMSPDMSRFNKRTTAAGFGPEPSPSTIPTFFDTLDK
jgi:uncharacterized protein (DUF2461 family)